MRVQEAQQNENRERTRVVMPSVFLRLVLAPLKKYGPPLGCQAEYSRGWENLQNVSGLLVERASGHDASCDNFPF
jgi:hypothetical protein